MTSRVIKFRAWDKRQGKMVGVSIYQDGTPVIAGNNVLTSPTKPKDLMLMQFTGLHDKNGVEIYEGDVVEVAGVGNAIVKICPSYGVCFNNGDYEYPYIDCAAEGDYPTVIGNIYENPELLGEPS